MPCSPAVELFNCVNISASTPRKAPRVAIVSDAMVVLGGAERLVEALAQAFPEAPIYAVLYDQHRGPASLRSRVTSSWLSRFPGATRYGKALLSLYPLAIESFDLGEYDIIISSHHTLAKGVLRTADQLHICYCHTPMRALWERTHAEIDGVPAVLHGYLRKLFQRLRTWDYLAAARVDHFIANSRTTQRRIATHYRRDSAIITPPIAVDLFSPGSGQLGDYYLVASRNVPYKRIDLAIAAAERLGHSLVVVGEGTMRLTSKSRNVRFLGKTCQEDLLALMQGAKALLAPQLEDFGMAVLEANACGRPVIAYGKGGALETVVDGVTGILFSEQSVDALVGAIQRFEQLTFDPVVIRTHAEQFSQKHFVEHIRDYVLTQYHTFLQERDQAAPSHDDRIHAVIRDLKEPSLSSGIQR